MNSSTSDSSNGNGNGSNSNGSNGWTTYGKLVLTELERYQDEFDKVNTKIATIKETDLPEIKTEIATLKVKSALWGAIAGTLFSALAYAAFSYLIHSR